MSLKFESNVKEKTTSETISYPALIRRSEQQESEFNFVQPAHSIRTSDAVTNQFLNALPDEWKDKIALGSEFYCVLSEFPAHVNNMKKEFSHIAAPEDYEEPRQIVVTNSENEFEKFLDLLENQGYKFDAKKKKELAKQFKLKQYTLIKENVSGFEAYKLEANFILNGFDLASDYSEENTIDLNEILFDKPTKKRLPNVIGTDYQLTKDTKQLLEVIQEAIDNRIQINALMVGESGSGKTSFAKALSQHTGLQLQTVNCQVQTSPTSWFGSWQLIDGQTVWVDSDFTKALEGGNIIILFDEINRLAPMDANVLLPLLDNQRKIRLESVNREIRVNEGVIVLMSANFGPQFSGVDQLDAALRSRSHLIVEFGELGDKQLENISTRYGNLKHYARINKGKLLEFYKEIRKLSKVNELPVDASTRYFENVVLLASLTGQTLIEITKVTFENQLSDMPDNVKKLLTEITQKYSGDFYETQVQPVS